MDLSVATESFLKNLLNICPPEICMWETTLIRAERYDAAKFSRPRADQRPATFRLWQQVWSHVFLMDLHHFPLWEREVHDILQKNFPALQRIFSHYTKGISGVDSAADALEMELEEFHDFVKDTRLETQVATSVTVM